MDPHIQHKYTNALINSGSPYLLQHAHNPVEWYPWGEEAWEKARKEQKPVLISIGYSACHWCHVMERESFENEEIAQLMNQWFVNIKVDREERPDVDMVYMDAVQLMTGKGGWPLNVFCLPDGRPIYGGTYFPETAWQQVLMQIKSTWDHRKETAFQYAEQLMEELKKMDGRERDTRKIWDSEYWSKMTETLLDGVDMEEGGLKRTQKFPLPGVWELMADLSLTSNHDDIKNALHITLLKMGNGGIFDVVGGGFCRYSTDEYWFAPHFEKMLYDNAQLISLYSRAFAITEIPFYKEIALKTLQFCKEEWLSEEGLYYSALDADSEGVEGSYYTWNYEEIAGLLEEETFRIFSKTFEITGEGNFENGKNILFKRKSPAALISELGIDAFAYQMTISKALEILKIHRNKRVKPGLDYKLQASWNALMLKALVDYSHFMQNAETLIEAEKLGKNIWKYFIDEGNFKRIIIQGKASVSLFLEDYSFLTEAYLHLFRETGKNEWLQYAEILIEKAINTCYDPNSHSFYFVPSDAEMLIIRKTDLSDDVMPGGNSIMLKNLYFLGTWLLKKEYLEMAHQMAKSTQQQTLQYPAWYAHWAIMRQIDVLGDFQIEITGKKGKMVYSELRKKIPSYIPVIYLPENSELPIAKGKRHDWNCGIYICKGSTCFEPVEQVAQALEILEDMMGINENF